jgi:hypothetical protein
MDFDNDGITVVNIEWEECEVSSYIVKSSLQRGIFVTLFVRSSEEGINLTHQLNMLKRAI